MADEQTPHSDLLDDAIREAEQQLEQKLQALRMSALSDVTGASQGSEAYGDSHGGTPEGGSAPTWADDATTGQWQDAGAVHAPAPAELEPSATVDPEADRQWEDAVIRPVQGSTGSWGTGGFVPDEPAPDTDWQQDSGTAWEPAEAAGGTSWQDAEPEPWGNEPPRARHTHPAYEPAATAVPTEEEVQFWAQTRTALRLLQQSTDNLTQQVSSAVTDQVERIVRDELGAPNATLRQLQQQLPVVADRIEQVVTDELAGPTETVRQLSEELPLHVERMERGVQAAVRQDVDHLERSIAENVTRMAGGMTDSVARAERSVNENLDRVERGLRSQFERIEANMRTELERVGEGVREELEAPGASIRQLHDELPVHFQRLERVVRDTDSSQTIDRLSAMLADLQQHQRELGGTLQQAVRDEIVPTRRGVRELVELDLGGVLGDLVQASRLTLDKLSTVAADADRDRVQRVEDLELLIDSMTTGWQGIYGAVTRLFDRVENFDDRIRVVESRLTAIGDLEQTVDTALANVREQLDSYLGSMQQHLQELQPAPVVVTVNHPEAQVAQSTRGGYLPAPKGDPAD